jgi:AraC-like DNA-binding protein
MSRKFGLFKVIAPNIVLHSVNLSAGYLTTLIRERTGRTVVEWIAEQRMAEARRLLVETDESVENVGARVGYEVPTYLSGGEHSLH